MDGLNDDAQSNFANTLISLYIFFVDNLKNPLFFNVLDTMQQLCGAYPVLPISNCA